MRQKTVSMFFLHRPLKGVWRLIQMQYPSDSVLWVICLLSRLLYLHNVGVSALSVPPPISLFTLCFSWLTQPFRRGLTVKYVPTHLHARTEKQAACSELRPFSLSTSCSFNKCRWSILIYVSLSTSTPTHSCTHMQHAAALPGWKLRRPSIIPPRCRLEEQLAAEEPRARHSLAGLCAPQSGCSMRARKPVILTEGVVQGAWEKGKGERGEMCRM